MKFSFIKDLRLLRYKTYDINLISAAKILKVKRISIKIFLLKLEEHSLNCID